MKLYFCACNDNEYETLRREKVDHILLSLAYWKGKMDRIGKGHKVIIDSGAYTNSLASRKKKITLDDYCEFVKTDLPKCGAKIEFMFMFDDIASRTNTLNNYMELKKRGINAVFVDHIRYYNDGRETADKIWQESDRVAISLPDTSSQRAKRSLGGGKGFLPMDQCLERMGRAWELGKSVNTKIHLLAIIKPTVIQKYMPDTIDTASWLNGSQYGNVFVYEVTDAGKARGLWTNIHTPRFAQLLKKMVKRAGLDYKKANDRDRFNVRSLLAYEKFLSGDRNALQTIRKNFALSEIDHEENSTIPGLLPLWAGPMVQPERAGLWVPNSVSSVVNKRDNMPSIKVPDAQHILKRHAAGKEVGLVSSMDGGSRIDMEQLLVNEPMRVGQSMDAWAVVKMGQPTVVHGPNDITHGTLDSVTQREFIERSEDGEGPFLYYPITVVKELDRPYTLRSAATADRVMSPIDKATEEAKTLLAVLNPEHLRAMKDEMVAQVDEKIHELFREHFTEGKKSALGGVQRDELVQGHGFLVVELKRREKGHETHDDLTRESDELRKADSSRKATASQVRSMPIGEVVDDAEWQKLRSGLRGKWTSDTKMAVAQLTEYLQSFSDPFRLRRALNLLTGSGFRTGRISDPSITRLRDKVRDAWKGLLEREKETSGDAVERAKAAIAETGLDDVILKHDHVRLVKADGGDEHFVLGIVLEPETEDSQGDVYSEKEVRDAAHGFMEDARQIGYMHREMLKQGVAILENYVAPIDMAVDGQHVKKGTWLLGLRVKDASLWKQIKDGTLTGLSIGGSAVREPENKD